MRPEELWETDEASVSSAPQTSSTEHRELTGAGPQARRSWYDIQAAYYDLTDADRPHEAPPESDPALQELFAKFGSSWGQGCQNSLEGCPGRSNSPVRFSDKNVLWLGLVDR